MTPLSRADFVKKYYSYAKKITDGTGIFIQTMFAQAILESQGRINGVFMVGGSELAKKYNNFFGIKADASWKDKKVNMKTGEVFSGQYVVITDAFRVYDSPEDSMADYIKFLKSNPRYTNAGVFTAKTYADQATALKKAGYATDPNYAKTVTALGDQVTKIIKDLADNNQIQAGSGAIKPSNFIIFLIVLGGYLILKR